MCVVPQAINNQADETYNEARHYGAGWDDEITNTNFLHFYNGMLTPLNQQVFIDGSSLTHLKQF